jgi:hypothetical protein
VRLTKGGQPIETKLTIGVDRRAPYKEAERREQFEAVMKAHALFAEMSALTDRMDAARAKVLARAKGLPESDPAGRKIRDAVEKLDAVKRQIVATKEGGAITGEERIREHLDTVYGALMSWEGKPAAYQVESIEALRRACRRGQAVDALRPATSPLDEGMNPGDIMRRRRTTTKKVRSGDRSGGPRALGSAAAEEKAAPAKKKADARWRPR